MARFGFPVAESSGITEKEVSENSIAPNALIRLSQDGCIAVAMFLVEFCGTAVSRTTAKSRQIVKKLSNFLICLRLNKRINQVRPRKKVMFPNCSLIKSRYDVNAPIKLKVNRINEVVPQPEPKAAVI